MKIKEVTLSSLLSLIVFFGFTLRSYGQDKDKDPIEHMTVVGQRPTDNGAKGSMGGNGKDGSTIYKDQDRSPWAPVRTTPTTLNGIKDLRNVQAFAAILIELLAIKAVFDAFSDPSVDPPDPLSADFKQLAEGMKNVVYAERAPAERIIGLTWKEANENYEKAPANSPQKERNRKERDFWNRLMDQVVVPLDLGVYAEILMSPMSQPTYTYQKDAGVIWYIANKYPKSPTQGLNIKAFGMVLCSGAVMTNVGINSTIEIKYIFSKADNGKSAEILTKEITLPVGKVDYDLIQDYKVFIPLYALALPVGKSKLSVLMQVYKDQRMWSQKSSEIDVDVPKGTLTKIDPPEMNIDKNQNLNLPGIK